MREPAQNLTAVTSGLADDRPEHGLGVSIRRGDAELEYLDATGIEEHAPMDWTPGMAVVLLAEHGYEAIGRWTDIDETGSDDPIWEVEVVDLRDRPLTQCSRTYCYCN